MARRRSSKKSSGGGILTVILIVAAIGVFGNLTKSSNDTADTRAASASTPKVVAATATPRPIATGTPVPTIAPAATEVPDAEKTYVLNTNSKKFHNPGCKSVSQIKEKNRKDYTGSRDDLITRGYAPCKSCEP